MDEKEFKRRTMNLGLAVIAMSRPLKRDLATDVLSRQVIRSATSVGANYRAACRARSDAEMLAKLSIVEEEADETGFWLEMLREAGIVPAATTDPLTREAGELLAMTVASIRTIRARSQREKTAATAKSTKLSVSNPQSEIRNPK